MWGATAAMPSFGFGWKVLFAIYLVVGIAATLLLWATPIDEGGQRDSASGFADCLRLLGKPVVLLSFVVIMCHVGIDVGSNTTAPKILMERLDMTLNEAAFATSLYFIFRTVGCLTGSFILRVMNHRAFFTVSILMMALSMAGLAFGTSEAELYTANAPARPRPPPPFSLAQLCVAERENEESVLMIMGLFGGTVFPLLMGFAADAAGQTGAVAVMAVGVVYLLTFIKNIKH